MALHPAYSDVDAVRSRFDHPVVDGDGHLLEFMPRILEIVDEVADRSVADRFRQHMKQPWAPDSTLIPYRVHRGQPGNTLDRMTAILPALLYRRLDEIGLDYALLYPSQAFHIFNLGDAEVRQASARAFNTYYAETFAGYRDRLEPVAVIPTFTPEEAVAELDYAVGVLGLKAIVMNGNIPRAVRPDGSRRPWMDSMGHDSLYDYDPVWQRCQELGVVPAFHGMGFGWGTRVSSHNYVHNHLGNFASAQESVCRSLLMGGVPTRFPELRFVFLEGGTSWSVQLFADMLGHFEKRNKDVVMRHADLSLDTAEANELFQKFAEGKMEHFKEYFSQDVPRALFARGAEGDIDDFAESGLNSLSDISAVFEKQFYFGCEADDPLNGLAFDRKYLSRGFELNAFLGSDIGHWDVNDMREVLPEAWELVDDGILSEGNFRDFAFVNVVRSLTDVNPNFFDGTVIEDWRDR